MAFQDGGHPLPQYGVLGANKLTPTQDSTGLIRQEGQFGFMELRFWYFFCVLQLLSLVYYYDCLRILLFKHGWGIRKYGGQDALG